VPSKVLLISANRCTTPYPVFPLGLCTVAGALQAAGHATRILDANCDWDVIERETAAYAPDAVGVSLRNIDDVDIVKQHSFVPDLVEVVRRVRAAADAPVILGGSAFSLFPSELLSLTGADYGIVGEGEEALCALVAGLKTRSPVEAIAGLVRRQNGVVIANSRSMLDSRHIPQPLRPARLIDYYRPASLMLNVQTQRGCGHTCCYCTYPLIEGTRFRCRPAGEVVDEIEEARRGGCHYFFVVDSVFNTSREHVSAVCEEIIRRGLDINWCCFLRPQGLDQETMDLMARAGLTHIEFGSDSFCDQTLAEYGKDLTFDDILASSECARHARIRYAHFLIFGGPGETDATLAESYTNFKRLARTVVFAYVGMRLYPGTPLHGRALREGVLTPDTPLLEPRFYVTPTLSQERIAATLAGHNAESKNWVVGDLPPDMVAITQRLRAKGVEGPLWEFLVR
jgi:radical SAM superfamily enzyme YgiQ (UPF0313 family)